MSKRAEQRGLEALPPRWRKTKDGKGKIDSALPVRKFYIRAYEQAEKDLGWHSVDESLPEMDEVVIVLIPYCREAAVGTQYEIAVAKLIQPIQYVSIGEKIWNIPGVKFWMPMPKIPEE